MNPGTLRTNNYDTTYKAKLYDVSQFTTTHLFTKITQKQVVVQYHLENLTFQIFTTYA